MRNISPASLATLSTKLGNEPISIVEIKWTTDQVAQYADRTIVDGNTTIPGRLLEVGTLDAVVDISNSTNSQQINLTLDDTDGLLKGIFNGRDMHHRPVLVYQWFEGLPLSDKFLVFSGRINTPITWNERDRSLKITVVSQIEDLEVGFSAEEGNFQYIPSDLIGKAWPMIFGTVFDYPALQVNFAISGVSLNPVGILTGVDDLLNAALYANGTDTSKSSDHTLTLMQAGLCINAASCWFGVDDNKAIAFQDQGNAIYEQVGQSMAQEEQKKRCAAAKRKVQVDEAKLLGVGDNPIQVLGGEDFPQNTTVTVNIGGGLFTGHFNGTTFYIQSRVNPQDELLLKQQQDTEKTAIESPDCVEYKPAQNFDMSVDVPCGSFCTVGSTLPCKDRRYGYIWGTATKPQKASSAAAAQNISHFWAEAGSKVILGTNSPTTYIASITPGKVLAVKAYQTLPGGVRHLTLVPTSLYTVQTVVYGTITAIQVVLTQPLSTLVNQGWEDGLYITFESTIGPDIVAIFQYLITNYTTFTWDNDSFEHVRTKLAPFPANFPLLDRKNILTVLKDIAFQSRCAIWLDDEVIYLKYLPEEPTAIDTVTVSDIDADNGLEIEFTDTENLVTKMNIHWRIGYTPSPGISAEQLMILRNNVSRYGLKEQDYTWYIFNQPDIIIKMATFWLIRYSNTWKRIKFNTFLNKLNLETFDCITFNVPGIVSTNPVNVIIQKASYDSLNNTISMECEVPVRAGEMVKYPFYWPSTLSHDHTWPQASEIADGSAGGGGIGVGASGTLPIGFTGTFGSGGTIYVGGPNVVYGPHADRGDRRPSDVGFVAQKIINTTLYTQITAVGKPLLHFYSADLVDGQPDKTNLIPSFFTLDLSKTQVMDSSGQKGRYSYFNDIFALLTPDGDSSKVVLDLASAKVADSDSPTDGEDWLARVMVVKEDELMLDGNSSDGAKIISDDKSDGSYFDFKYDEDGEKLGAGTAFLKEE